MRWPWVSRAAYTDLTRATERSFAQCADAIRMAERATELALGMMAKLDRFIPAPSTEVTPRNPLPVAAPPHNDLTEAIELASGTDRGLARHLTRWAKEQALDGMKERDIIQSILHWPRATEWDGEPDDVPDPAW